MTAEVKFKDLPRETYDAMFSWCRENFGREALWVSQLTNPAGPSKWYSSSNYPREGGMSAIGIPGTTAQKGGAKFVFRDDANATLFSLRWGDALTQDV
jgi:hypothetical protein